MSTGISHFSICSLPPVRTRLHNVLPHAHGPSPSCAHRAGFWGFEQAAAPPVRGFPGFAFRLRSRAAKSAKQEPPSEFIRLDVHAVKARSSLRVLPLNTPCAEAKIATAPAGIIAAQPPAILTRRLALCATTPPQATAFTAHSASSSPLESPLCAHAQGQSRVRACRTVLKEYAAPAARGMQTEMPPKQAAWRGKCGKG